MVFQTKIQALQEQQSKRATKGKKDISSSPSPHTPTPINTDSDNTNVVSDGDGATIAPVVMQKEIPANVAVGLASVIGNSSINFQKSKVAMYGAPGLGNDKGLSTYQPVILGAFNMPDVGTDVGAKKFFTTMWINRWFESSRMLRILSAIAQKINDNSADVLYSAPAAENLRTALLSETGKHEYIGNPGKWKELLFFLNNMFDEDLINIGKTIVQSYNVKDAFMIGEEIKDVLTQIDLNELDNYGNFWFLDMNGVYLNGKVPGTGEITNIERALIKDLSVLYGKRLYNKPEFVSDNFGFMLPYNLLLSKFVNNQSKSICSRFLNNENILFPAQYAKKHTDPQEFLSQLMFIIVTEMYFSKFGITLDKDFALDNSLDVLLGKKGDNGTRSFVGYLNDLDKIETSNASESIVEVSQKIIDHVKAGSLFDKEKQQLIKYSNDLYDNCTAIGKPPSNNLTDQNLVSLLGWTATNIFNYFDNSTYVPSNASKYGTGKADVADFVTKVLKNNTATTNIGTNSLFISSTPLPNNIADFLAMSLMAVSANGVFMKPLFGCALYRFLYDQDFSGRDDVLKKLRDRLATSEMEIMYPLPNGRVIFDPEKLELKHAEDAIGIESGGYKIGLQYWNHVDANDKKYDKVGFDFKSFLDVLMKSSLFQYIIQGGFSLFVNSDDSGANKDKTKYRLLDPIDCCLLVAETWFCVAQLYWPFKMLKMDAMFDGQMPTFCLYIKVPGADQGYGLAADSLGNFASNVFTQDGVFADNVANVATILADKIGEQFADFSALLSVFFPGACNGAKNSNHLTFIKNVSEYVAISKDTLGNMLGRISSNEFGLSSLLKNILSGMDVVKKYTGEDKYLSFDVGEKELYKEICGSYMINPGKYSDLQKFLYFNQIIDANKSDYDLACQYIKALHQKGNGRILVVGIPQGLIESIDSEKCADHPYIALHTRAKNLKNMQQEAAGTTYYDMTLRFRPEDGKLVRYTWYDKSIPGEIVDLCAIAEAESYALKKYLEISYGAVFSEILYLDNPVAAKLDNIEYMNRLFPDTVINKIFNDISPIDNNNYINNDKLQMIDKVLLKKLLYCFAGLPKNVFSKLLSKKFFRHIYFVPVACSEDTFNKEMFDQYEVEVYRSAPIDKISILDVNIADVLNNAPKT